MSLVVLVAAFGMFGAPAAVALAPAVASKAVAGTYTLHVNWYATHYIRTPLTLYPDHTGADSKRYDTVTWSRSGKNVTIDFSGKAGSATYHGVLTASGISTRSHPGTMVNSEAGTGTFYATRTG